MPVAFALAGLAVVLLVAVLAVGWFGELPEARPDRTPLNLPAGEPLSPADVSGVRFAVAARGYRMDEVDTVLERVAADLADRDDHIAFLQQRCAERGIDPYAAGGAPSGEPGEEETGDPGTTRGATGDLDQG